MPTIAVEWYIKGSRQRKTIDMERPVTIGRHPACDIILGDPHVSRKHAAIFFNNDSFHIHNLSRTNPIIFNDRWTLAHDLKADLKVGDSFIVGRVRMKVKRPRLTGDIGLDPEVDLQVQCPSCGQMFDYGQDSCIWCGTSLAEVDTVELEEPEGIDRRAKQRVARSTSSGR